MQRSPKDHHDATIIIVNDGSNPSYNLTSLSDRKDILYKEHIINRGYGASLKTGILAHDSELIAITDADGTYPIDRIPSLQKKQRRLIWSLEVEREKFDKFH